VLLAAAALLTLTSCELFNALFGNPPTAAVAADPSTGPAPLAVTFDLSGSDVPSGLERYRLDFGDATSFATGTDLDEAPVHTYAQEGTYTAVLEITDRYDRIDHDTVVVTVGGAAQPEGAPVAVLAADDTIGDAPLIVNFDVSLSSSPESRLVSFRLDFDDGTQASIGTGFSSPILHLYADPGVYTAVLTVTDAEGLTGTATLDIVATAEGGGDAPVARFDWTPTDPFMDQVVTFDADGSYDLADVQVHPMEIVVYTWDFGDGAEAATTAETVDHTYTWPGTYDVTLTVYDDDGVAGTSTQQIDVSGAIAYVASFFDGSVHQIRLPSNTVSHAGKPFEWSSGVAIDPDGASVYVGGASFVTLTTGVAKLRTSDHSDAGQADAQDVFPFDVACSPNGNTLYAVGGFFGPEDQLVVINSTTMAATQTVTVQSYPATIAFSPTANFAYVVGEDPDSLIRIDTTSHTVAGEIDLTAWGVPWGIAVTSDGAQALVTLPNDGDVLFINLGTGTVDARLDLDADPSVTSGSPTPVGVAITHDDALAYVTDPWESRVYVIDIAAENVVDEILLDDATYGLAFPWDIAITPGDSVAVVPFGVDEATLLAWWVGGLPFVPALPVFIIDLDTNNVTDTVLAGFGPLFVDVWGIGY
jgi:PKD repeat protein